jgi:hypothetical protein
MRVLERNDRGMVTVAELTTAEARVKAWFDEHLDTEPGTWGIMACAKVALTAMPTRDLTAEFAEYLSDGTLTVLTSPAFTDPAVVEVTE